MLVLGGGMANTFLHAKGVDVGASLAEKDMAEAARKILSKADTAGCEVLLPVDGMVAKEFKAEAPSRDVPVGRVPADMMILDVGPKSVEKLTTKIPGAKTVLWKDRKNVV